MNVPRQIALGTTMLIAVMLAGAGSGAGYLVGRQQERDQNAASRYPATVVSLYPDRIGGCLEPAAGSGVSATAPEGICGPFFWEAGMPATVGAAVQVIEVPARGAEDEDLQSYLLSPSGQ